MGSNLFPSIRQGKWLSSLYSLLLSSKIFQVFLCTIGTAPHLAEAPATFF